MVPKFQDSELKIMEVLWKNGDMKAKDIAAILTKEMGWNPNTTYTLIKRCIDKGGIERQNPNYICHACIEKEEVQRRETKEFVDKIYEGSEDKLFAALVSRKKLTSEDIKYLKELINKYE